MDNFDDEMKIEFIADSEEMLDKIEPLLLDMSDNVGADSGTMDENTINSVFRLFHSIKGSAGFFGFLNIQEVTHQGETLLDAIRQGQLNPTKKHIDLLLNTMDFLRTIFLKVAEELSDKGFEEEVKKVISQLKVSMTGSPDESSQAEAPEPEGGDDELQLEITADMKANFAQESIELLDEVEHTLLALKEDFNNSDAIEDIFRNIHTFKGNSGFFGYADLENLSHKMETTLDQ